MSPLSSLFRSSKKKSRAKKRSSRGRRDLPLWLLGLGVAVVIGGIGGLKWAGTGQGQAVLLSMGSEKMYGEVQDAVDEALGRVLPGFRSGPLAAVGADPATAQDPVAAVGDYDWPAPELGPGAAIRCRRMVLPETTGYWEAQRRIAAAVERAGGRILWGERLYRTRRNEEPQPDEQRDALRLDIGVIGKPTHTLVLVREAGAADLRWDSGGGSAAWDDLKRGSAGPTVAIVIDDWGYNQNAATQEILNLPVPVTMAVLPGLSYSRQFALKATDLVLPPDHLAAAGGPGSDAARARALRLAAGCEVQVTLDSGPAKPRTDRREVMLHLPMQPQSYPETNPGPDAVLVGMDEDRIAARLEAALDGLPRISGLNNHMGSAATADTETMRRLMKLLKERGFYFVDSLTTARSQAHAEAVRAGVPALKNRIFLDYDHKDPDRIAANLAALVRSARSTGFAVGICHPHPQTARVLARELPRWVDEGVQFVTVSEMLALRGDL